MPRDQRLYMTFPIDFWTHPKVSRLSDAAFRAFVESNGHSRMRESDGVVEAEDAEFLWPVEALTELTRSHPTRPLMIRAGEAYVLRDYAEHQFTKADRDALSRKRAEAGAKGGKATASAKQVLSKSQQTAAESESGSGLGITTKTSLHQSSPKTARQATDPSDTFKAMAQQFGINHLRTISDAVYAKTGLNITDDEAYSLSLHYMQKAKREVQKPQGYVLKCIKDDEGELERHLHEDPAFNIAEPI